MDENKTMYRVKDWEKFQHYKKKNKNFNNEQKWFMFYGGQLLRDYKFMTLTIDQRDFLVMCWAIASQDNGFLPEMKQIQFYLQQRDVNNINENLKFLLENEWLEIKNLMDYEEIQVASEAPAEKDTDKLYKYNSQDFPMTDDIRKEKIRLQQIFLKTRQYQFLGFIKR